MKTLNNLRSFTLIVAFALLAGCAGISDANLTETADDAQLAPVVTEADFQTDITSQNNGGDEDIIEVPPKSSYDDRE